MTHIELPRALEDYFAYAEIDPTRAGRRFVISLPYFDGDRLDRLRWWYHLTRDQEQRLGDAMLATLRAHATAAFRKHIERWLQNTGKRLHGADPIPHVDPITASEPVAEPPIDATPVDTPAAETPESVVPWPADRVATG
jgi:hypothetical protein